MDINAPVTTINLKITKNHEIIDISRYHEVTNMRYGFS